MKIRTKFLLFFILAFLFPLLFLSYLNFNSAKTILNNTTNARLSVIAKLQGFRIDDAVNLYKSRAITLAAQAPRISDLDSYNKTNDVTIQDRMNKSLSDTLRILPDIGALSIINQQGKIVSSTNPEQIGKKASSQTSIRKIDTPFLDFIQNSGSTPQIRIRKTIINNTIPIGTLEIVMKDDFISTITNDHSFIGSTGEFLLASRDTNGNIFYIIPRRFEKQAKNESFLVSQALKSTESFFLNVTDYRGESVVSVTKYIPDLNWGIVVKLDTNEAFQSINNLRDSIIIFGFIFTIIVIMVMLFFTHSITAPITNLVSVLTEVRTGDLSKRAVVLSKDELGELAITFNFVLESLQKSRNELAKRYKEQAELAAIVEFSDDAIISNDLNGLIRSWNNGAQRMYGYSATEMVGAPINKLVPKEGTDEIPQILAHIKRGESVDHIESVRMKKDGSLITVSISASPIKDNYGAVIGAAAIARDITEKQKLQEAESRLQLFKAVEAANKELEAFSYSVSHDLRAPLRAIDGFSKILSEDYATNLNDDGKHIIETIRNSTKQMGNLIDDLLAFSRVGRQEIKTTTVDMTALVKSVFEEVKAANPGRHIEFVCTEIPNILADPALMHQVWMNLLSNSVKFTKNQDLAKISVGSTTNNGKVIYTVKDNGAGFDMKYIDKLFGVFQRLHSTQDFEGTGIGLSIVKRIIEKHGGTIWAEAAVDAGATFYFSLPQNI